MSRREPSSEGKSLDNYEGALETREDQAPESSFTQVLHELKAALPSSYLVTIAGTMAISLALRLGGRAKWARFVLQCLPVGLIIGIYRNRFKLEDHDSIDGAGHRGYRS